jgi:hypothetical protein
MLKMLTVIDFGEKQHTIPVNDINLRSLLRYYFADRHAMTATAVFSKAAMTRHVLVTTGSWN